MVRPDKVRRGSRGLDSRVFLGGGGVVEPVVSEGGEFQRHNFGDIERQYPVLDREAVQM